MEASLGAATVANSNGTWIVVRSIRLDPSFVDGKLGKRRIRSLSGPVKYRLRFETSLAVRTILSLSFRLEISFWIPLVSESISLDSFGLESIG